VSITARVIGDGLVSALRTLVAMTTERCRATTSNGVEDLLLRPNVMPGGSAAARLAHSAGTTAALVLAIALIASFWLREPQGDQLPD
jgi:hypothetical protein